jgi:ABC-2 type transport system permease protein
VPIYELGYRRWEGPLRGPLRRWMAIARTGIGLAFSSKLLKRMIFFGWTPILYFGPLFFAIGWLTDPTHEIASGGLFQFAANILGPELAGRLQRDPESVRPAAWALAFHYFFSVSQTFLVLLVVGIIAPPLISKDVGSKAFLLYFSKPITRSEYVFGKAAVVLFFVALVTLFPGILLYIVSIAFSPTIAAFWQTAGMLLRIVAAFAVIAIPATLVALLFSSLASDVRYASIGWVSFWMLGWVAYEVLTAQPALARAKWVFLTSFFQTNSTLTASIFDVAAQLKAIGVESGPPRIMALLQPRYPADLALWFMGGLSVVSLIGIFRRISAPMRI